MARPGATTGRDRAGAYPDAAAADVTLKHAVSSPLRFLLADDNRMNPEPIAAALRTLADGGVHGLPTDVDAGTLRAQGASRIGADDWQLAGGLELLDPASLRKQLATRHPALSLDVLDHVDSTNRRLLARADGEDVHGSICTSEWQTAGRGRRGRAWQSPFGRNIAVSLGWQPPTGFSRLTDVGTVPLVLGIAAAHAVERLSGVRPGLKWPNDLYLQPPPRAGAPVQDWAKLGGILVESRLKPAGPVLVCGIGINVHGLPEHSAAAVEQPWVPLAAFAPVSRNALLVGLLDAVWTGLDVFARQGFEPFRAPFDALDITRGQRVEGRRGEALVSGRSLGIDAAGALQVETDEGVITLDSGEVSVRLQGTAS